MSPENISVISLLVALFSLWLSYRNRIEQLRDASYSRYLEAQIALSRCDSAFVQVEANVREFWRLSFSHAKLKSNDFDEVIEQIKVKKHTVDVLRKELLALRGDPQKIESILNAATEIFGRAEPLMVSLKESASALQQEIDRLSGADEHTKIEKLRTAISHMKQWEKF